MTEKLYNDYKDYLINKLEVGNNGSSYLNLPVTIVDGDFVHPKFIKEYGTGQRAVSEEPELVVVSTPGSFRMTAQVSKALGI